MHNNITTDLEGNNFLSQSSKESLVTTPEFKNRDIIKSNHLELIRVLRRAKFITCNDDWILDRIIKLSNADLECRETQEKIASIAGCSRRTIARACDRLKKGGWIKIKRYGHGYTSVITVTVMDKLISSTNIKEKELGMKFLNKRKKRKGECNRPLNTFHSLVKEVFCYAK